MICKKCNHKLPDDSEFCQYCGSKIEAVEAVQGDTLDDHAKELIDELNNPDTTSDDTLSAILKFQAKATIDAMGANAKEQPDNEGDEDFGLVPEKPIFTFALKSVDGEEEYLDRLYTESGEKIKYTRRGSTSTEGINGMIDIYDTFLPSGQLYKTLYINMYGAKSSVSAPKGFAFDIIMPVATSTKPKCKKKAILRAPQNTHSIWCSNKLLWVLIGCAVLCLLCALVGEIGQNITHENSQDAYTHHKATINNDTVGCGSIGCKYCAGVKTEYSYNEYGYPVFRDLFAFYHTNDTAYSSFVGMSDISYLLLFFFVMAISIICFIRFKKNIKNFILKVFQKKNIAIVIISALLFVSLIVISVLAFDLADYKRVYEINRDKVEQYEEELADVRSKVNFMDNYIALIEDDGSNLYHKYDCYKFKGESFWAYNLATAKAKGYKPCSSCCD